MGKYKKILFAALIGFSVGVLGYSLSSAYFAENSRVKTQNRGFEFVGLLSQKLRLVASLPRAIASHVSLNAGIDQEGFERISKAVRKTHKIDDYVGSLQLAPGGVVTYEQPLKDGPHIGHNLLADPKRRLAVERAITLGVTITDGPLTLLQGGSALISRYPILTTSEQEPGSFNFWGLATVLIYWDKFEKILQDYESTNNSQLIVRKTTNYNDEDKVIYGIEEKSDDWVHVGKIDLFGITLLVSERPNDKGGIAPFFVALAVFILSSSLWFLLLHNIQLKKSFHSLSDAYYEKIYEVLIRLSLLRDNETGGHQKRVAEMADILREGAKNNKEIEAIKLSASDFKKAIALHDIGKVGISDSILLKRGPLTSSELSEMKRHAELGASLIADLMNSEHTLKNDPMLKQALLVALHHHENWDGSGYPHNLKGQEIPCCARIMSIVDVYDALRSERSYKKSLTHAKAVEIMKTLCGSKFDPEFFKCFLKVADQFETIFDRDVFPFVSRV